MVRVGLGFSIAVSVRVIGLGTGNDRIVHCFIFPCLKVTNTCVLPSWPGAYLAGAHVNQWAYHRKHVTTVTSVLKVL